jgi:class 3 adenylate cyclase
MHPFDEFQSGDTTDALVCFTDIAGFARFARGKDAREVALFLLAVAEESATVLAGTSGRIIKYIGDASLIAFPAADTDAGVRALLRLKQRVDGVLAARGHGGRLACSAHVGQIALVRLPPVDQLDVLGDTVNTAAMAGRSQGPGRFAVTPQVFRKLESETRKAFHKFTPPVVYLAEQEPQP